MQAMQAPIQRLLGDDIMRRVLSCLNAQSLAAAGMTCKHWNRITEVRCVGTPLVMCHGCVVRGQPSCLLMLQSRRSAALLYLSLIDNATMALNRTLVVQKMFVCFQSVI